jgi:crossover junction endodeoxyribonuclease RuvC
MKILGIDPGTATTGFAVIEKIAGKVTALDFGIISTRPKISAAERLLEIAENIAELLATHHPEIVAVELLFFCKNQTTAIAVAQSRGAVLAEVARFGAIVVELTPLQVKMAATGSGRADKKQVQKMVQKIFALDKIPRPDDAADALAIAFAAS